MLGPKQHIYLIEGGTNPTLFNKSGTLKDQIAVHFDSDI